MDRTDSLTCLLLLLQWINSNRFLHPRVKALEIRALLACYRPHAHSSAGGKRVGGVLTDSRSKSTHRGGELISKKEILVLNQKKEEWVLKGPKRPMSMTETRKSGCPSGLSTVLSVVGSQGFLTHLRDYWNEDITFEYHSFVLLVFMFLQISTYACMACDVGPLCFHTLSGIIQVDQCAFTRGHRREAGALW